MGFDFVVFFALVFDQQVGFAGLKVQAAFAFNMAGQAFLLQLFQDQVSGGALDAGDAGNGAGQGFAELKEGQINSGFLFVEANVGKGLE